METSAKIVMNVNQIIVKIRFAVQSAMDVFMKLVTACLMAQELKMSSAVSEENYRNKKKNGKFVIIIMNVPAICV